MLPRAGSKQSMVMHMVEWHTHFYLYNNSVTLFGHLCFVLGPIHLRLVPGWSTTEGESFDPGMVAILPTSENTTLTPTTARRSFAWLPNSLEHLFVFQTSPPCPFHVFTRPVVSRREQWQNRGHRNFKHKLLPGFFPDQLQTRHNDFLTKSTCHKVALTSIRKSPPMVLGGFLANRHYTNTE